MKIFKLISFVLLICATNNLAQYKGNRFALSTNFSYTTESQIFLTPDAPNIFDRDKSFVLEDILSYSAELRYRFSEWLIMGLSFEQIEKKDKGRNLTSREFIVEDGYIVYPLELSAYYYLPFSTEDFKFFMGGGFGFYFGKRTRSFGTAEFNDVTSEIGYGILVNVGMDYMIFDFLSVRGEFLFRDPEIKVTSKYNSPSTVYNNREYSLQTGDINSKININGITFRIGAVYHFNLF